MSVLDKQEVRVSYNSAKGYVGTAPWLCPRVAR